MANAPDTKPKAGNRVVLIGLPSGFLHDLPGEDQRAISDVVGRPVRLSEYDELGRAVLEFKSPDGTFHTIYVGPDFIRAMNESERAKFESEMKEITTVFDHYRVNARTIWNTAFWPDPDFRNWDSIEQFHEIEKILFGELVLAKVDQKWSSSDLFVNAIPFFQIVPSIVHGTPIMIQKPRSGASTGYWDDPINLIKLGEAELQFIAYFDWNQMDYIDLRYYRVRIASFDSHPELVGREALVEHRHAAVYLTNESS